MPGLSFVFEVIRSKWSPPKDVRPSFNDRTVLVTGANVGLGLEAAVKFVELGAKRVVLAVRSIKKGENAQAQIEARTGRRGVVEVWQLDMLDYENIKAFAKRVDLELDQLDVAVLNAGIMSPELELSRYGIETTLQVNAVSTTLLALLLLPKLRASSRPEFQPVLELVSSGNHNFVAKKSLDRIRGSSPALETLSRPEGFSPFEQYNISKLLLMYAQLGLVHATRVAESDKPSVEIVAVCPGATESDLARDYTQWYMKIFKFLFRIAVMKTTEEGARTYISGTDLKGKGHGRFWTADTLKEPSPLLTGAENEKLQIKVFDEILTALEREVPETSQVLAQLKGAAGHS